MASGPAYAGPFRFVKMSPYYKKNVGTSIDVARNKKEVLLKKLLRLKIETTIKTPASKPGWLKHHLQILLLHKLYYLLK